MAVIVLLHMLSHDIHYTVHLRWQLLVLQLVQQHMHLSCLAVAQLRGCYMLYYTAVPQCAQGQAATHALGAACTH
jgi:hypothetical protein